MDRRRRALGIKKPSCSEEKVVKVKSSSNGCTNTEDKHSKGGKESQNRQSGNSTPTRRTPKRKKDVTPLKTESLSSPLQSPGYQSVFPRTLGSPEIEVSWDWGCSQVPKDMLPVKRVKRVSQSQPSPLIIPSVTPCPRLLPDRPISEEENRERLAFYKNVMSKTSKRAPEKIEVDSKNNNLEGSLDSGMKSLHTTPKGSNKLRVEPCKKEEQINALFDDSANELMFECSQAIEEKLKSGEIDMGRVVKIKIPNQNHVPSPEEINENACKKVCHGKSKVLFPEGTSNIQKVPKINSGGKRCLSLKSPQSKEHKTDQILEKLSSPDPSCKADFDNDDIFFMKPTQVNQDIDVNTNSINHEVVKDSNLVNSENEQKYLDSKKIQKIDNSKCDSLNKPSHNSVTNSHCVTLDKRPPQVKQEISLNALISNKNSKPVQNINVEKVQNHVNIMNYDSVNKFRRNPINKCTGAHNTNSSKPYTNNNTVMNKSIASNTMKKIEGDQARIKDKNMLHHLQEKENTSNSDDFNSLLDDGLDMELSSLDFESLCCSSVKEPQHQAVNGTAPKLCTQQEIEAKRLAALNRLMMKKKR